MILQIDRYKYNELSLEDFISKYEKQNKPVILSRCEHVFKTNKYWSWQDLYERYKDETFKVGEDDKGKKIRIPLKYYLEYMV